MLCGLWSYRHHLFAPVCPRGPVRNLLWDPRGRYGRAGVRGKGGIRGSSAPWGLIRTATATCLVRTKARRDVRAGGQRRDKELTTNQGFVHVRGRPVMEAGGRSGIIDALRTAHSHGHDDGPVEPAVGEYSLSWAPEE